MRWDTRRRPFMEAWYLTATDPSSGSGYWFRYTLTAPLERRGEPYCELWAFVFDAQEGVRFAGKRTYPISALRAPAAGDEIVCLDGGCLTRSRSTGSFEYDGRILEWDLDMTASDRTYHHLPSPLRDRIAKRISTVCSPNLGTRFSGSVVCDGEKLLLEEARGQQGHRWGRRHATSWAWAHCSLFDDGEEVVFEGLSAKPPVGPTLSFLYLRLEGEDIALNDLRSALTSRSDYVLPAWVVTSSDARWKVVGSARAHPDRVAQVTYTDPDGDQLFCANSEVAGLALEIYRRSAGGWRHHRSLTSTAGAHLEFGAKEPFEGIPLLF